MAAAESHEIEQHEAGDEQARNDQRDLHPARHQESFTRRFVSVKPICMVKTMPRLWTETIESHRREVRDAILETTAKLAAEQGVLSVTMSQIAEETGIGRATLYKYFPDVEAILLAWHEKHIQHHLDRLAGLLHGVDKPGDRLEAVLEAYAFIQYELRSVHGTELGSFLHRDEHVADTRHKLHGFVRRLIADAAAAGTVRQDVGPDELAVYCLHALGASASMRSKGAVSRLVSVTLDALRTSSRRAVLKR